MLKTFLKGIIVFVLLSISYFVYTGMTHHEGQILTSVEIDATSSDIYPYLAEPAKSQSWIPGLSSITLVSGEEMEVGSKYRMVFEYNGKQMSMSETITAVEQDKRVAFDLTSDFVNSHIDIHLSESGGVTTVTETNTYSGNNFLARAMTGMTKKSTKARQQEMYDKLKDVVEHGE
ncbi:MAG: hypothetical protein GY751_12175 [Bacteroidetes bacterium]|nr:hypothetical protein [Bacteroidota bacterium]